MIRDLNHYESLAPAAILPELKPSLIKLGAYFFVADNVQNSSNNINYKIKIQKLRELVSQYGDTGITQIIQRLQSGIGFDRSSRYLEFLLEHDLLAEQSILSSTEKALNILQGDQIETSLFSMSRFASKAFDNFKLLVKAGTIERIFKLNDIEDQKYCFKFLQRMSLRMNFSNEFSEIVNLILNKLDGKELKESLNFLESYMTKETYFDFSPLAISVLQTASSNKLHRFLNLLDSSKLNYLGQSVVALLLDDKGSTPIDISDHFIQRLGQIKLGNEFEGVLDQALHENFNSSMEILRSKQATQDYDELPLSDKLLVIVSKILHSGLDTNEIGRVSFAIFSSYLNLETHSLAKMLMQQIDLQDRSVQKLSGNNLLKLAETIIAITNKENGIIRANISSSKVIQEFLVSGFKNSEGQELFPKVLSKYSNKTSGQLLVKLEAIQRRHGKDHTISLLKCLNQYASQEPTDQVSKIAITENIFEYLKQSDSTKAKNLLDIMNSLPALTKSQQKLLLTLVDMQEELSQGSFLNAVNNLKYLKSSDLIKEQALRSYIQKPYSQISETETLPNLAIYLLLHSRKRNLSNILANLADLNRYANAFNQQKAITELVLKVNQANKDIKIDFSELEKNSTGDLRYIFQLINETVPVSKQCLGSIAFSISSDNGISKSLKSLTSEGDFDSYINLVRPRNKIVSENFFLIELTKLYQKYLYGNSCLPTIRTVLMTLIAANAPVTVIESFIKKLSNYDDKNKIQEFAIEVLSQVEIAKLALKIKTIKQASVDKLIAYINQNPNYDDRSFLQNLNKSYGSLGYFVADSAPAPASKYDELAKEILEIYRSVYDTHHGFGALTYDFRRTPNRDDPSVLKLARDIGNKYFHFNSSLRDKYPGKGIRIEGLDNRRMFGFSSDLASSEQQANYAKLIDAYKQNLPWLAEELDDIGQTKYTFLTGMMVITPPETQKYYLPGLKFSPVHYSLITYSDHFDSDVNAVSYLVPTEIIESKLTPSLIEGGNFTSFDPSKPDICNTAIKISDLEQEAKKKNLNILNLGWASNLRGGMCNAYPLGSQPFHDWENHVDKYQTKDLNGHVHKTHINNGYDDNFKKLSKNMEYMRLATAHKVVYDVSKRLSNLKHIFQLALSLRHKGYSYYNEEIGDDQNPDINLSEDFDSSESNIFLNPHLKYMLKEAYKWHYSLHKEAELQERKADPMQFPVLAITPTFSWSAPPDLEICFDTFDRKLHIKRKGEPNKILQFGKKIGEHEEYNWNEYFVKNAIATDKDIRLLDRAAFGLAA